MRLAEARHSAGEGVRFCAYPVSTGPWPRSYVPRAVIARIVESIYTFQTHNANESARHTTPRHTPHLPRNVCPRGPRLNLKKIYTKNSL